MSFLGVKSQDLNKLRFSEWNNKRNKLVVLQTVSFQGKKGFNTHRLLRAIDKNTLLSKLEVSEQGKELDTMLPLSELYEAYHDYPELIGNTKRLLAGCKIEFDFSKTTPKNQQAYTGNMQLDYRLLKKLTYGGLDYRYKTADNAVIARIEKEPENYKREVFCVLFFN